MLDAAREQSNEASTTEEPDREDLSGPLPVAQIPPLEWAGQWLAWSPDGLRIVGHGETIAEALRMGGGGEDLVISRVPRPELLRPTAMAKPPTS